MTTIHTENISGTASSGAISVNTVASLQGITREIIISPATPTTIYDVDITNDTSLTVFKSTSVTGDLIEETALPMQGVYTVAITSSTADELFTMALVLEE